jgi:hypothetical protein
MAHDVVDGFVIDKVFQPIADAFPVHVSCFKISNFLLDGMPLVSAYTLWPRVYTNFDVTFYLLLVFGVGYYYWFLKTVVRRVERACRPDTANAGRYLLWPMRLLMVGLMAFDVGTSIGDFPSGLRACWPNLLALLAIYFCSCRHTTRTFRRRIVQPA